MGKGMKHIYVAGRYRGKNAWDVEQNIRVAEEIAFKICEQGAVAICPHSMERFFHGTLSDEYWINATKSMLQRCDAIMMCPGWDVSEGSLGELAEAHRMGIPRFYWEANGLPAMIEWLKENA